MDRYAYDNPLRQQCLSIPELCHAQIAGVRKGLAEAFTMAELSRCRRVIITGCGDSYAAAKAAIPAFRKFAGRFGSNFTAVRAIDAARYMKIEQRNAAETMIIGVSCSGGPARIQEVLRRANEYGCMSLAITNNPDSPAAKEAAKSLIVHTPSFPNASPGLRNYFASLTGLYMFAAMLGEATRCSKEGVVDEMAEAIADHIKRWETELDRIDAQMFELAVKWRGFRTFDYIGDGIHYASAFFMGAKMVEVAGRMTAADDSENWCHVGFFQKDPHHIGTVIAAGKQDQNRSRIRETVKQAAGIGRPLLLITDGTKENFGISEEITLCTVPQAPEGFEFLSVMMNYIPGSLLAGYISSLSGEAFFRGGGVWSLPENNTIRSSVIEVV